MDIAISMLKGILQGKNELSYKDIVGSLFLELKGYKVCM